MKRFFAIAWLSVVVPAVAGPFNTTDTVTVSTTDELREVVAAALPGVTICIKPGEYAGGLTFTGLRGAEGKPILIRGDDPKNPPRFVGGSGIHLVNPAYVELRDIVIERSRGNGLNIDDGGTMKQTAYGIGLTRVIVRDLTSAGNYDGIKLSGLRGFVIDGCVVEKWGSGGSAIDMVGCADGRIANCVLRHNGPEATSTGVQCKGGTRDVLIERCRFDGSGQRGVNIGGSTGLRHFRPQPPAKYEAKDIAVRGCTFAGVSAAVAFVGCDGAVVEQNTIYRPRRWAMRILQETTADGFVPCRGGVFRGNVIVWRAGEMRTAVNIGPNTAPDTFEFAGNWWYCIDRPGGSRPSLPTDEADGIYGRDPKLTDPERGDFGVEADGEAARYGAGASE